MLVTTFTICATLSPRGSLIRINTSRAYEVFTTAQNPTHVCPNSKRKLNVVLFGESGAGMSSVINLLAGHVIAKTSDHASACTLQSEEYEITLDGRTYCVWDTVGLVDTNRSHGSGHMDFVYGVQHAHLLIQMLARRGGGVDLLLFCMRGGRITRFNHQVYNLFYEVLCGRRVAIAAVLTHLEHEGVMEEWWIKNKSEFEKYGMGFVGHACVTALSALSPDYSRLYAQKISESRRAMIALLRAHNDRAQEPARSSSSSFFNSLGTLTPKRLKGRKAYNTLTKRCGYDADLARQIAEILATGE
ncbi:hypothetical protein BU15DRAFT_54839 [Melanogaster broomeanus]|nr:hypothetical protein BU15DRAFT_54839 [Melanogaster broomeanus]